MQWLLSALGDTGSINERDGFRHPGKFTHWERGSRDDFPDVTGSRDVPGRREKSRRIPGSRDILREVATYKTFPI